MSGPWRSNLLTNLVSAVVPVAVAAISILPDHWKLKAELEAMKERNGYLTAAPQERRIISGRIKRTRPGGEPGQYEVYLVPGNNFMASPDADGKFRFEDLFPGSYSMVVREVGNDTGPNGTMRVLVAPQDREDRVELGGTSLEYRVEAKADAPPTGAAPKLARGQ